MIRLNKVLFLFFIVLTSCSPRKLGSVPGLVPGVSRELANYRKAVISDVHYVLELDIPAERKDAIPAIETLSFQLKTARLPMLIDFKENPAKIKQIAVNGKSTPVIYQQEHLIIAAEFLRPGRNAINIMFQAGEGALNRNTDYLYTLFVPDRARTFFPCFDQPDLKATYTLTLKLPRDWTALANADLQDSVVRQNRKIYQFKKSDLVSTYLFAFAAGKFNTVHRQTAGRNSTFLHRETDTGKISHSLSDIFKVHSESLKYFEDWTGVPYPFQKFGFVAIPDFQFGGMEHPGTIQYKAATLFLDAGATKDQLNARTNLIAHETAHMWFGDMVTMNWFTDVWMKEVFANFMADKSSGAAGEKETYDLKFLIDHVPAAYAVDRTAGANPIRQPLDNLEDAGTLYGNIIYHKAPVMMQQLEQLMGKEKFQEGVREYLRTFMNKNASWPDLINILDHYTTAKLQDWNKVWVNESGRPVIDYTMLFNQQQISSLTINQHAEYGIKRIWPQAFDVTLFYPDSTHVLHINLSAAKQVIKQAAGLQKPLFVLFNSGGQGYALWPVDPVMPQYLYTLKSPLYRASAYISLYEHMLSGKTIKPAALLSLFSEGLLKEQEELNIKLLTGYISSIYWQFMSPEQRKLASLTMESVLWTAMQEQKDNNIKKQLFKSYQDIFLNTIAHDRLYQIWKQQQAPAGIKLAEDDYTNLALALAVRDDADTTILTVQYARITNPDRKERFKFIMPAVSSSVVQRDSFFSSLSQRSNREKESNVLAALYYLHHPLRQRQSYRYLQQSLDLLDEIQITGDIFFPQSWLQATFGSYQSVYAAKSVCDFLEQHPAYNPRLKAKILQATDNLFRAAKEFDTH